MMKKSSTVQLYVITIAITGVLLVSPVTGLSKRIQLMPVDNSHLEQLISNPAQDQAYPMPDQANPIPGQANQLQGLINLESDLTNSAQGQIEPKLIQVKSKQEDILSSLHDDKLKAFDLSKDQAVNNQADIIEEEASYLFFNEGSIDQQTKLENENKNPILPEEDVVDLTNLNFDDYMYLLDNKENTMEGENQNKKGQGIDDMFYVKPLGLFQKTQKFSVESLDNFFDDKVIIDANAIDYSQFEQNIQPVNGLARIQIITFFEEIPETVEHNQRLPSFDNQNNFEIPSDEIEKQLSVTKSRISLFVFGWMFMVTGIALSCFIVIVGKRTASKRTLKVKKFTSPGEQPYQALGSEV